MGETNNSINMYVGESIFFLKLVQLFLNLF